MVAHLLFGHRRIRRHERSGERTELADDFGMASLNEGAERLRLLRRGHVYLRFQSSYASLRSRRRADLTIPWATATCALFAILWPQTDPRRKSSEDTTP